MPSFAYKTAIQQKGDKFRGVGWMAISAKDNEAAVDDTQPPFFSGPWETQGEATDRLRWTRLRVVALMLENGLKIAPNPGDNPT